MDADESESSISINGTDSSSGGPAPQPLGQILPPAKSSATRGFMDPSSVPLASESTSPVVSDPTHTNSGSDIHNADGTTRSNNGDRPSPEYIPEAPSSSVLNPGSAKVSLIENPVKMGGYPPRAPLSQSSSFPEDFGMAILPPRGAGAIPGLIRGGFGPISMGPGGGNRFSPSQLGTIPILNDGSSSQSEVKNTPETGPQKTTSLTPLMGNRMIPPLLSDGNTPVSLQQSSNQHPSCPTGMVMDPKPLPAGQLETSSSTDSHDKIPTPPVPTMSPSVGANSLGKDSGNGDHVEPESDDSKKRWPQTVRVVIGEDGEPVPQWIDPSEEQGSEDKNETGPPESGNDDYKTDQKDEQQNQDYSEEGGQSWGEDYAYDNRRSGGYSNDRGGYGGGYNNRPGGGYADRQYQQGGRYDGGGSRYNQRSGDYNNDGYNRRNPSDSRYPPYQNQYSGGQGGDWNSGSGSGYGGGYQGAQYPPVPGMPPMPPVPPMAGFPPMPFGGGGPPPFGFTPPMPPMAPPFVGPPHPFGTSAPGYPPIPPVPAPIVSGAYPDLSVPPPILPKATSTSGSHPVIPQIGFNTSATQSVKSAKPSPSASHLADIALPAEPPPPPPKKKLKKDLNSSDGGTAPDEITVPLPLDTKTSGSTVPISSGGAVTEAGKTGEPLDPKIMGVFPMMPENKPESEGNTSQTIIETSDSNLVGKTGEDTTAGDAETPSEGKASLPLGKLDDFVPAPEIPMDNFEFSEAKRQAAKSLVSRQLKSLKNIKIQISKQKEEIPLKPKSVPIRDKDGQIINSYPEDDVITDQSGENNRDSDKRDSVAAPSSSDLDPQMLYGPPPPAELQTSGDGVEGRDSKNKNIAEASSVKKSPDDHPSSESKKRRHRSSSRDDDDRHSRKSSKSKSRSRDRSRDRRAGGGTSARRRGSRSRSPRGRRSRTPRDRSFRRRRSYSRDRDRRSRSRDRAVHHYSSSRRDRDRDRYRSDRDRDHDRSGYGRRRVRSRSRERSHDRRVGSRDRDRSRERNLTSRDRHRSIDRKDSDLSLSKVSGRDRERSGRGRRDSKSTSEAEAEKLEKDKRESSGSPAAASDHANEEPPPSKWSDSNLRPVTTEVSKLDTARSANFSASEAPAIGGTGSMDVGESSMAQQPNGGGTTTDASSSEEEDGRTTAGHLVKGVSSKLRHGDDRAATGKRMEQKMSSTIEESSRKRLRDSPVPRENSKVSMGVGVVGPDSGSDEDDENEADGSENEENDYRETLLAAKAATGKERLLSAVTKSHIESTPIGEIGKNRRNLPNDQNQMTNIRRPPQQQQIAEPESEQDDEENDEDIDAGRHNSDEIQAHPATGGAAGGTTSICMIRSKDDDGKEVEWPADIILKTRCSPSVVWSCKPDRFESFKDIVRQLKIESDEEEDDENEVGDVPFAGEKSDPRGGASGPEEDSESDNSARGDVTDTKPPGVGIVPKARRLSTGSENMDIDDDDDENDDSDKDQQDLSANNSAEMYGPPIAVSGTGQRVKKPPSRFQSAAEVTESKVEIDSDTKSSKPAAGPEGKTPDLENLRLEALESMKKAKQLLAQYEAKTKVGGGDGGRKRNGKPGEQRSGEEEDDTDNEEREVGRVAKRSKKKKRKAEAKEKKRSKKASRDDSSERSAKGESHRQKSGTSRSRTRTSSKEIRKGSHASVDAKSRSVNFKAAKAIPVHDRGRVVVSGSENENEKDSSEETIGKGKSGRLEPKRRGSKKKERAERSKAKSFKKPLRDGVSSDDDEEDSDHEELKPSKEDRRKHGKKKKDKEKKKKSKHPASSSKIKESKKKDHSDSDDSDSDNHADDRRRDRNRANAARQQVEALPESGGSPSRMDQSPDEDDDGDQDVYSGSGSGNDAVDEGVEVDWVEIDNADNVSKTQELEPPVDVDAPDPEFLPPPPPPSKKLKVPDCEPSEVPIVFEEYEQDVAKEALRQEERRTRVLDLPIVEDRTKYVAEYIQSRLDKPEDKSGTEMGQGANWIGIPALAKDHPPLPHPSELDIQGAGGILDGLSVEDSSQVSEPGRGGGRLEILKRQPGKTAGLMIAQGTSDPLAGNMRVSPSSGSVTVGAGSAPPIAEFTGKKSASEMLVLKELENKAKDNVMQVISQIRNVLGEAENRVKAQNAAALSQHMDEVEAERLARRLEKREKLKEDKLRKRVEKELKKMQRRREKRDLEKRIQELMEPVDEPLPTLPDIPLPADCFSHPPPPPSKAGQFYTNSHLGLQLMGEGDSSPPPPPPPKARVDEVIMPPSIPIPVPLGNKASASYLVTVATYRPQYQQVPPAMSVAGLFSNPGSQGQRFSFPADR